jgi:hypothetical protein
MEQSQVLTLIEQAMQELGKPRPRAVQAWLKDKHDLDLPIEQVHGNMQIVRETAIDEYEHLKRGEEYQNEKEQREAIRDTQGGVDL